jgi:competence protein ComEA
MSTVRGGCTDRSRAENTLRREAVTWPWPVGARGVLAAAVIFAAMGMAMSNRFDRSSSDGAFIAAPDLVVDPNTAPAQVLTALPHIGPALIREMVSARDDRPFSSLEDAGDRVRGLGPATLAQIAPYLWFDSSTQFDVDHLRGSGSERPVGKSLSIRRKPARSRAVRQISKSSVAELTVESSQLEARRQLSIARRDQ